jgi:zinc transport system substrate-binding protein
LHLDEGDFPMKKKLVILLGIMLLLTILGSVIIHITTKKSNTETAYSENKLRIVSTFYPVYMIGSNLAEGVEGIQVDSLTDLNTGCLHDYQLTTEDMKLISNADVMIINGGGMEGFIEDVMSNYPMLTIIDASEGITMLPGEEHEEHGDEAEVREKIKNEDGTEYREETEYIKETESASEAEHEEATGQETGEEHDHGEWNAHVWLDPQLYIRQINNVAKGLNSFISASDRVDKSLSSSIQKNADTYIHKIEELDTQVEKLRQKIYQGEQQIQNNQAVIFHDSFLYLANRIGITVAHSVPLDSDTTLSAGEIAEIVKEVKEGKIRYLFTEEQFSDSIASQIAAETGASVYIIDSAVTGDGAPDSYLRSMQKNIDTLAKVIEN